MKDISDLIYLDNHATTPCDPAVVDAMLPFLTNQFGHAASRSHAFGWNALDAVELARDQVGSLINATGKRSFGPLVPLNLIILPLKESPSITSETMRARLVRIITVLTEHKAVLDACKALMRDGWDVTFLKWSQMSVFVWMI